MGQKLCERKSNEETRRVNPMKIVVLGSYGFIGKSVMEELQSRGYSSIGVTVA